MGGKFQDKMDAEFQQLEENDRYFRLIAQLDKILPKRVRNAFLKSISLEDNNLKYFDRFDVNFRNEIIEQVFLMRTAYFSIHAMISVVSDVEMCARMIRRYPWHGTDISKGDHFVFVWSNFVNHCYIFEERAKTVARSLNKLNTRNSQPHIAPKAWVKKIKKKLLAHIKFRGQDVHQWPQIYEKYEDFKFIELMSKIDSSLGGLHNYSYRETKKELEKEIRNTRESMITILSELKPDPVELLSRYCTALDAILEKYEINAK